MSIDVQAIQGLIVLVVPVLIFLTRIYLPRIPKNLYPVLAPLIGAALELTLYSAGLSKDGSPLTGAILGGLGTWLREVQDQLKRPFQSPTTVPVVLLALLVGLSGCVGLVPISSQATVAEQLQLIKEVGGSQCAVVKLTGTYPGFASGQAVLVYAADATPSHGVTALECLKAIQPELQRFLAQ